MRDFELYQAVLGLQAPWAIVNVELDMTRQQVTVTVDAGPGPYLCPECQETVPGYDRKHRRWRHLDTCQFTTWVQTGVPRVSCPVHGVKQITVPWAEPGSQFTAWFERLAIDLLRECSVKGAAGLLRLTWDEAWGIKARAVTRGLHRRTQEVVQPSRSGTGTSPWWQIWRRAACSIWPRIGSRRVWMGSGPP
jgi:transposase